MTFMVQTFMPYMGSKRRLVPQLLRAVPQSGWSTYHEPFLGSGALLYALEPSRAIASDRLSLLMQLHQAVAHDVNGLIEEYEAMATNKRDSFFAARMKHPNVSPAEFLFLIKHCHGNRHRVNQRGQFNTPFKENSAKVITRLVLDRDACKLREAAAMINRCEIEFRTCAAEEALSLIRPGSFVFLDPPYQWKACKEYDYGCEFGAKEWRLLMLNVRDMLLRCGTVYVMMTLHGGMREDEVRDMARVVPGLVFLRPISYSGTHLGKGGVHPQHDWLLTNYNCPDSEVPDPVAPQCEVPPLRES